MSMSLGSISHPILYSTMTAVAYNINMKYYSGRHYMWCTPYFGSDFTSPHFTVPPSSSPLEIYNTIKREIDGSDLHETKIKQNRIGIKKGASSMLERGVIDGGQYQEVIEIARRSPMQQFRPLLCIISRVEAASYHQIIDIKKKANPLSHEYIVADLPQSAFDVIRIG